MGAPPQKGYVPNRMARVAVIGAGVAALVWIVLNSLSPANYFYYRAFSCLGVGGRASS